MAGRYRLAGDGCGRGSEVRQHGASWATLGLAFAVGLTLALSAAAGAVSPGQITEFRVGGAAKLTGITGGPDGNVWFVDGTAIGRITPAGTINTFSPSTNGSFAIDAWNGITLGPDGNLWATATILPHGGLIAQIAPNGTFLNLFSTNLQTNADPTLITPGPNGSHTLWFIDNAIARGGDDDIGRITTGGTITEFSASAAPGADGLVAADGQLWLSAAPAGAGLGTIDLVNTSNGTLETEYSPGEMEPDFDPQSLAADSHGNLYYTLDGGAELNTSGQRIGIGEIMDPGADATVTAYAAGLQANEESDPIAIADGPDGNMYFVDDGKSNGGRDELGELNTTTHAITELSSGLAGGSVPSAITRGPDGNVWFTDQGTESIGQLNLTGSTPTTTTTGPTTMKSPPPQAPAISKLRVSPRKSSAAGRKVHGRCVKLSKKNTADKPCQLSIKLKATYTLNTPAKVSFKLALKKAGRNVSGKCVKATHKNKHHSQCTLLLTVHRNTTRSGVARSNKFSFTGKFAAGTYELIATPAGVMAETVTFKVTG